LEQLTARFASAKPTLSAPAQHSFSFSAQKRKASREADPLQRRLAGKISGSLLAFLTLDCFASAKPKPFSHPSLKQLDTAIKAGTIPMPGYRGILRRVTRAGLA